MEETFETGELTTVNIVNLFETNKAQRRSFAEDYVQRIDDGEADPLKSQVRLKCMATIIEDILSNETYKELVLNEALKEQSKQFDVLNATMNVKEAGVKYNFSKCNDEEWYDLNTKLEKLKAQVKERETLLKALPTEGIEIVNKETGEVSIIYPPSKSSTTIVAVTLK